MRVRGATPWLVLGAAAWMAHAGAPHLVARRCPRRGDPGRPWLALTFDDGPDPRWTPRVQAMLRAYGIRATFFLVGQRAAHAPEIVQALAADGHEIASHGWSHTSLWLCGPRRTRAEIVRTAATLAALTDRPPRLFRPPWGMVNATMFRVLRETGEIPVFWSIQPEGLRPVSAARQVHHVVTRVHRGAIVDLHDAEGTPGAPARLLEALPAMIDGLRGAGYEFATAGELLGARG